MSRNTQIGWEHRFPSPGPHPTSSSTRLSQAHSVLDAVMPSPVDLYVFSCTTEKTAPHQDSHANDAIRLCHKPIVSSQLALLLHFTPSSLALFPALQPLLPYNAASTIATSNIDNKIDITSMAEDLSAQPASKRVKYVLCLWLQAKQLMTAKGTTSPEHSMSSLDLRRSASLSIMISSWSDLASSKLRDPLAGPKNPMPRQT